MLDLVGDPNCWFSHAQAQFTVPPVEALRCYFCADNGAHDKCGNYSTYLEARMLGPHSPYLRNCSAGNDNICYIETYKSAAGMYDIHFSVVVFLFIFFKMSENFTCIE